MRHTTANAAIVSIGLSISAILMYGCGKTADSVRVQPPAHPSPPSNAPARTPNPTAMPVGVGGGGGAETNATSTGPAPTAQPIATLVDARPAALVNGAPLTWAELRPTLNELAGAEALQEVILDRRVNEALVKANITITEDNVAFERKLLLESLSDDPNHAIRLLDELRDRQRLGTGRFEALMRRNAGMRALIAGHVRITDEAVRNMHELVHGPKRQARLMVLPNLEQAQAALNLINSGVSFADAAVEMSIDSSAPRGGLLEPISRVDPAYPESIRQTLWSLNPGEMSGPVLLDDRYAVVMLVKRIAGDGAKLEDMRPALERAVRIQQERLHMDALARNLLADTQVTVFDESLHDSWNKRSRRR